ncbi:tail fiber assembly protein [Citrobacter freundii]|uniref:tail fiber assembly protein n=1 Tax=Citrobacter freundii TaxID=546 RepID=UPI002DBECF84|nr:tail fiber assembly protein [Citrobacter freundii]MEB6428750.1 tail fiber assembly protein [Citrobacter freundii]
MASQFYWSPSLGGFLLASDKEHCLKSDIWPADAVEINDAVAATFMSKPAVGQVLGNVNGEPAWVDAYQAGLPRDIDRQNRVNTAIQYIDSMQWRDKALTGRLGENDLKKYGQWIDYIDELKALDIAEPVTWPSLPA